MKIRKKSPKNPDQDIRNVAIKTWHAQKYRCERAYDKMYKYYGAKGVIVKYGKEEFVSWFISEFKKKDKWSRASVGRINHDGHYELTNVEMVEASVNSKEMVDRTKSDRNGLVAVIVYDDKTIAFSSMRRVATYLNITPSSVTTRIQRQKTKKKNNEWKRKFHGEIYTLDQFMEL